MLALPQFYAPPTPELEDFARSLYERRANAVEATLVEAHIGDWVPDANRCHDNVATWVAHQPHATRGDRAVRGWHFFDYGGFLPFVRFNAHSLVHTHDGYLIDITPNPTGNIYPFIVDNSPEEEYHRIERLLFEHYQHSSLYHRP